MLSAVTLRFGYLALLCWFVVCLAPFVALVKFATNRKRFCANGAWRFVVCVEVAAIYHTNQGGARPSLTSTNKFVGESGPLTGVMRPHLTTQPGGKRQGQPKGKLMLFFFITASAAFVLWTASMGYIVFVGTKARFDRFSKENVSDPEMDWFDELY